jgi:hypothetical protein
MEATFDSGTDENWVSKSTVAQLKCSTKHVEAVTYHTFTGETLESSKMIRDVRWRIDTGSGGGNISRWANFRVAPEGALFQVLFGSNLILSEEIFSFKEAAFVLIKGDEAAGGFLPDLTYKIDSRQEGMLIISKAVKKTKEDDGERAEAEAQALAAKRQAAVQLW